MSKKSPLSSWSILVLGFFLAAKLTAQQPALERLGAAEGLSQGMIFDMLQDRQGFLWFATKDGLNRYDGYSFLVFHSDPFDPFSISDNEVQCLAEDHLGRIWAGTVNNGLNLLDPQTGKFYHIGKLSSQYINSVATTPDGAVWVGTNKGVNRVRIPDILPANQPNLSAELQVDTFFWDNPAEHTSLPLHALVDLKGSRDGKLWVSTFRQVGCFDPASGQFQKVWTTTERAANEYATSFFREGPDGAMWVGQAGQLLRIQNGQISIFRLPETSPFPYTSITFDRMGNLFVGTRKQVYKLSAGQMSNPGQAAFQLFYRFPMEGIIGSTELLADRGGLLWIGTNGYGLLKHNPGNAHFVHYLEGKSPRRIFVDAQNRAWVWMTGGIFWQLNEADRRASTAMMPSDQYFQHDCISTPDGDLVLLCEQKAGIRGLGVLIRLNGASLQPQSPIALPISVGVYSRLCLSENGTLWVTGSKSEIACVDLNGGSVKTFYFGNLTGYKEASLEINIDPQQRVWICTPHGLVQGTPTAEGLNFVLHQNNPNDRKSLNCNYILSFLNDPANPEQFAWVGTRGGGLCQFDKRSGTCTHYTTTEGLPNNVVYSILPDKNGALWMSTNCGLSKFDPKTRYFQNYYSVDGLQDNEFNTISYARAADGRLFFGGVNGVTAFYPEALSLAANAIPVYITGLKINNQPVRKDAGILEKSIEHTQHINLDYFQNQLTFEFSAMDFSAPRMNQFRYRLLDADQNWAEPTTDHSATYAQLPPGDYIFEVVTGGSRGIWNPTPARLSIHIAPPWWRTPWAYGLYALALMAGAWAFYRFQLNKIRLENKLDFEHQEALRLLELDRLKTNFFSSVTHEFRTPLTLLLEPARQLLAEAKDKTLRYRLELIENNARRLLQFVNQLLDLSKLEAGQMPLDLRPGNPAEALRAVAAQFQPLAHQRSIELALDLGAEDQTLVFDALKWEQVVSNLLSNALKFTEKGGKVVLKLETLAAEGPSEKMVRLSVADTGVGIPAEELPRIFDRFYQASSSPVYRGGTGIGLSLSKELVERMGGRISVQSELGKGTRFVVDLPCEPSKVPGEAHPGLSALPIVAYEPPAPDAHRGQALLLLIEDDTELRQFLRASLPPGYRIAEAADGAEGIEMALELVPDLVISDLMMPRKDGFEVAETLKNNTGTSHIPLILLTAKSALESKVQGLRRGADVYLNKPFRADELVAHIENLLANRQRLQEYFMQTAQSAGNATESAVGALPALENEFLQRLIQIVEDNLDNDAMDAEAIARGVYISRSQLHRKISALTGLSITEFVRNYRLDRAREMLAQQKSSISEIAWRTGFPNAKYFSTRFKERFGVPPSGLGA